VQAIKNFFPKRIFLSLSFGLIFALSLSAQKSKYPGLSRNEALKQELRLKFLHLADISLVKVYDHYKWQRKLAEAEKYARQNPPSPVNRVVNFYPKTQKVEFLLETRAGKQGWMIINFPEPDMVHIQAGLGDLPKVHISGEEIKTIFQNNQIILKTSLLELRIDDLKFHLAIYDAQGNLLLSEPEEIGAFAGLELGEKLSRQSFLLSSNAGFYGGGEQYQGWNHRGRVLIMDIDDAYQSLTGNTYIPIPFFITNQGFAFFLNTYQKARFDFGKKFSNRFFFENPDCYLDYYLIFAPPKSALEKYAKIVGTSPLIPGWSLEPWISRRTYLGWRTPEAVNQDLNKMLKEEFPFGVLLWENMIGESEEHIDLRPNLKTKSNLPEYIDRWHQLGLKVVGWHFQGQLKAQPRVLKYYGLDRHPDYLVRNPDGTPYIGGRGKNKVYLDITNPEAWRYFWEKIYQPLFTSEPDGSSSFEHLNLDGIKLDFCEYFPGDEQDLIMYQRLSGMRLRYPSLFGEWLYQKLNQTRKEGGIIWQRGGGLGAHKVGFVWTGDRGRTWLQFKHTLIAGLNASASGIALWGTDLGGYIGGGIQAEEVYNRAVAFSCFSVSFHDHGSALAPWDQSERGKDIYRFYARLRYNLLPYLYHYLWEAHLKGLPIVRPMFLECPEDKNCWEIEDQYFFGEKILVAPIFKHTQTRQLYLPEGEWMDFWNGKIISGKRWIKYPVPRSVLPVFVRKGSMIPVQLSPDLKLAGKITQENKDNLITGFLVFDRGDFHIAGDWKVFDPRIKRNSKAELELRAEKGGLRISRIKPIRGVILVYAPKPEKVYWQDKMLAESSCPEQVSGKSSFWCWREDKKQTVIYITK